jgi:hypothetical protein
VIPGTSQLQLPEKRFLFHLWFPATELASLLGNLPVSPTSSTVFLANCSLPELSHIHNLLPGSPPPPTPFLAGWDFSRGGGGTLGKRVGKHVAALFLRAASPLFLGPLPPTETQPHTF